MIFCLGGNRSLQLVAIALIVLGVADCQRPNSTMKEVLQHFASGEVSRRHTEVNGKKEGVMTEYYIDGSVRSKRIFKNDLQVGRSEFFYPKGQIKEVQYFNENGLKHGGDTSFYESGKPQLVMGFKDGKKDGYLRKWSPEGQLIYEARYEMDTLVEVKGEALKKHGR